MFETLSIAFGNLHTFVKAKTTIVPYNQEGDIIILKRHSNDEGAGSWELPGGGIELDKVSIESDLIAEAKRELFEETGLITSEMEFLGLRTFTNPKGQLQGNYMFGTRVNNINLANASHEHEEIRIISASQAVEILSFDNHKFAVNQVVQKVKFLDK
jgi:8-oxo-dGTP pyrophosphatase MutT (NUDIX family)